MNTNIYSTIIIHQRFYPFKHKFKYTVLSLFIDYDELLLLSKKLKIFSYNKFNLYSFYEKDHGYRDGRSLKKYVQDFLDKNDIPFKNLKIKIICFPRILGYVFNPLSIIYCYSDSNIIAIFYEVKNTSNEQHTYCFAGNDQINNKNFRHKCNKNFYVSPFIGMQATYEFKNKIPNENMSIVIDLYDKNSKKILTASQYGNKIILNSFTFIKQLIINPMVTLKIIFAILYEALFIIIKGGKYYSRTKKTNDTISFEGKL